MVINVLVEKVEVPKAESLKTLSFQLKQEIDNLFSVLIAEIDGKAQIAVMISDNLVAEKGLDASKTVRELASLVQGGGGGQKFRCYRRRQRTQRTERGFGKGEINFVTQTLVCDFS